MRKVLGMGNALVDVLAIIENDNVLELLALPKGSMQLIDEKKLDEISKEINKLDKSIVSGGSAANTIVGLARLGVQTGFIGRIGNDPYGDYFKKDLAKYNVKSHLSEVNERSGVASAFISQDGERTFGTYLGAAALLNADELDIKDFKGYDYFYIEGYLVQSHTLIEKAIQLAKEVGAKVVVDMASYNVVEENKEFLLRIIPEYVDIVLANEEEAKALMNMEPEDAVSALAKIVDIAIVKVGDKGSLIQHGDEKISVPALKVNSVDTTGAGDLYASGFLYGLINNCPLNVCGQIGTLLAGNVIENIGAKIPDEKWNGLIEDIKSKL